MLTVTQFAWLAVLLLGADELQPTQLQQPAAYSVTQRQGFEAIRAHANEPDGPRLGSADVLTKGEFAAIPNETFEYRTVLLKEAFGRPVEWTPFQHQRADRTITGSVRIPAGGWYRLEFRQRAANETKSIAQVEPIGVGEVFLIAGQSYADGANDELQTVEEQQRRVSAYDVVKKTWSVANDPQPNKAPGGTIWPALGDFLVPVARVPVGFVNVAVGGTASRQWLPGEALYKGLEDAGVQTKRFRAVLWQQGESDVIENVSTEKYIDNLTRIRTSLAKTWGHEPPWLLAKSTLHPTVYVKPAEEGRIRDAIQKLYQTPGFRPGPDTDILAGENRGGLKSRRHFSPIGQRRAALLWFTAVWNEIHREPETK
jgi:hypothetical protein